VHIRGFPDGGPPPVAHDLLMSTLCDLHLATGAREECPRSGCAFWEDDGCAFDRVRFELQDRPDVAGWLLGIRRELERARETESSRPRGGLQAILPPGLRD
jgi:hypothetical protein